MLENIIDNPILKVLVLFYGIQALICFVIFIIRRVVVIINYNDPIISSKPLNIIASILCPIWVVGMSLYAALKELQIEKRFGHMPPDPNVHQIELTPDNIDDVIKDMLEIKKEMDAFKEEEKDSE